MDCEQALVLHICITYYEITHWPSELRIYRIYISWHLITPMYLLEFLGAKSRLMSMRGVPFTLRSSRMRVVSSSLESESLSNIARWDVDRRNSVKFEWMKSTAENREKISIFFSFKKVTSIMLKMKN